MRWKSLKISRGIWVILGLIVLTAARWSYVQSVLPTAYTQDEAAILLNAQLLDEQGVDEWGRAWPINFSSFGDSKLPGYLYSVFAAGQVFGLEWWSVRIPSFAVGIILPVAVGWLVQRLGGSFRLAVIAALGVVLSPWSWHYGTTGYEAHLGLLLWVIGLGCLAGRPARWWLDILAAMLLALSILTYNAPLLLLPALLVWLVWWRWPHKGSVLSGASSVVIGGGVAGLLTLSASVQKGAISIFQDPTLWALYPAYRGSFSGVLQTLLGNQWVYFAKEVVLRWAWSWDWEFLVMRGGSNPWNSIPGTGHLNGMILVLFGLSLPLFIWVTWQQYRRGQSQWKTSVSLFWLLATALTPAMITVDAPHATRSLFFFVMLTMVTARGMQVLWRSLKADYPVWGIRLFGTLVVLLLIWHTILWLSPAQVRWKYFISPRWNKGLIEALRSPEVVSASTVYIVDSHGTLYTYAAVNDPVARSRFLETVDRSGPSQIGLYRVHGFDRYRFIDQPEDVPATPSGVLLKPRSNMEWDIISL